MNGMKGSKYGREIPSGGQGEDDTTRTFRGGSGCGYKQASWLARVGFWGIGRIGIANLVWAGVLSVLVALLLQTCGGIGKAGLNGGGGRRRLKFKYNQLLSVGGTALKLMKKSF